MSAHPGLNKEGIFQEASQFPNIPVPQSLDFAFLGIIAIFR